MDRCKSAVSFLREKALSKSEKSLRKAGFKDSNGQWTGMTGDSDGAVAALLQLLLDEHEPDLVKLADEMIAEEKKSTQTKK